MLNNDIQVFDQKQIAAWQAEIHSCQLKIANFEQKIIPEHQQKIAELTPLFEEYEALYETEFPIYQQQCQPLEEQRNSFEQKISELQNQIQFEEDDVNRIKLSDEMSQKEKQQLISRHNGLILIHKNHIAFTMPQLSAVQQQLAQFENRATIKNYRHQLSLIETEENAIKYAQTTIQFYQEEITAYQNQIEEAGKFLNKLREKPEDLFRQLQDDFLKPIKLYAKWHARRDIEEIHIFLLELPQKIQFIAENIDQTWHQKYACLLGYLWSVYHRAQNQPELAVALKQILQNTHIAENGALPDELACGSCATVYKNFKLQHPVKMRDVDDQYDELRDSLLENLREKRLLDCSPMQQNFYQKCKAVVATVERQREIAGAKFNKPLYTTVLKQTAALVDDPTNLHVLRQYKNLAASKKVDGQRSYCKLVCGAVLAVVGVALTVVSTLALVFSAGLSIKVTAPAIAARVITTIAGMSLFRSGLRKGTANSMFAVAKSATQLGENIATEMRPRTARDDGQLSSPLLV